MVSHEAIGWAPDGSQLRATLHVVLLQLGQDVLPVCIFAQSGDVGSDLVHDDFALRWLCHVDHPLYHVVGVLVLHHAIEGAVGPVLLTAHLIDKQSPLGS